MAEQLDQIDRKLIGLLQADARLSNAELADKVGLTTSSVHERVKKLEKRGVITGYVATVDAEKLGKPMLAFVRATVAAEDHEGTVSFHDRIVAACRAESDILECHNVAGEDCFIIKVRAESPKDLERILQTIRSTVRSSRSVTNIVLSTYKESTRVEPAPAEAQALENPVPREVQA
ncbi:MAG TPA: Lrp/AsnC family transcriptional regulator [Rectinemataceae bacterium]|nr:Lrp/AsnC family transcriptional regulator [Rectinemataceae bacterium]